MVAEGELQLGQWTVQALRDADAGLLLASTSGLARGKSSGGSPLVVYYAARPALDCAALLVRRCPAPPPPPPTTTHARTHAITHIVLLPKHTLKRRLWDPQTGLLIFWP